VTSPGPASPQSTPARRTQSAGTPAARPSTAAAEVLPPTLPARQLPRPHQTRNPASVPAPPGPAAGSLEPERERLRKDIFHRPGEIQRQQQRLLLQRLEPVHPPGRHHELQPRPVTLPPPPGEPANRLAPCNRNRPQIPDQGHSVPSQYLPRGRPLPRPPRAQRQPGTLRASGLIGQEQLVQPAAIRPHRQHIAHGHLLNTTCR
jgi:hypothetical protein